MLKGLWFSFGCILNPRVLIGSLVSVFLVVMSVVISAKCISRRRQRHRAALHQIRIGETAQAGAEQAKTGHDRSIIEKLPVFIYKPTDGQDESGIDCAVCLGAIKENEMVRLLPNCKHLFRVDCIDMWLQSHSTCPICRTEAEPVESGESVAVKTSALPVDLGASDGTEQSAAFRRMMSSNTERLSKTRVEAGGPSETVGDLERQ